MSSTFWDQAIKVFEIASIGYGSVWFSKYLDKKKLAKESNMDKEFQRKKEMLPILEDVRRQLDADRCFESVFSNGDTTFNGHHMKKLSVILECHRDDIEDIGHHFQFIPTKKFDRLLSQLYDNAEDYCISDETQLSDDLSNLKKLFNLNYTLSVVVRDQIDRWVGMITVSFSSPREISDQEIAYVKAQASRIGALK